MLYEYENMYNFIEFEKTHDPLGLSLIKKKKKLIFLVDKHFVLLINSVKNFREIVYFLLSILFIFCEV